MSDTVPFHHDLLDATSEGLVRVDARGIIVYANRAARGLLGDTFEKAVIGQRFDAYVPGGVSECSGTLATLGDDGGPTRAFGVTTHAPGPDGSVIISLTRADRAPDLPSLERYFGEAPFAVALLEGPEHVFRFANREYRALFAPRDFLGRRLRDAFPEVLAHGRTALYEDVYRYGRRRRTHERVLQLAGPDGSARGYILNIQYEPVRDERGRVCGILLMMTDVTEEVLARDLIGGSGQNLRQVLDASAAVVWVTDERGRCTYISRKWFELTGRAPTAGGDCWYEDIHPADVVQARAEFDRAIEARQSLNIEYRVIERDGSDRRVINIGYPRHDRRGRFLGHIGTLVEADDRTRILWPRERGCSR